ncbi:MAG: hypothetical protein A3D92_04110 [Bacteroidetes bacterium RIFCSPHIGHO2_02_FULL_44_7]|nr:MAG: hypothetical protein A3D92_04110 [Bacteroidetes bacterium RIFCSPHIGHO2_02_FULL_44_7]
MMNWGGLIFLFGFSIVKFMFTPFSGPAFHFTFIETYIACVAGGIFGAAIFYFSAGFFMRRSHDARVHKLALLKAQGIPYKLKRKFTRMNKFVVRIKRSLGIVGTSFWAPFFLSVPIGSIIAAKFYGHQKKTFPLIVLGMLINGCVTTGIAYLFYG